MTTQPQPNLSDPHLQNMVLQLHIAEYQALTSRATNWLTLLSGVWVLMAVFITLLPSIWSIVPHVVIVWGALAVLQLMLIFWSQLLYEQYTSVRYIEGKLRCLVAELVGLAPFWQYETYVRSQRPKTQPMWYEAAPAYGIFLLGILIVCCRTPLGWGEYVGLAANLAVFYLFLCSLIRAVRVRRKLTEPI